MAPKGRPYLKIRVDEDLPERLQAHFPSQKGKAGDVSLAVRKLLYVLMDDPVPPQYGEKDKDETIDYLETVTKSMEREACRVEEQVQITSRVMDLLDEDGGDPVWTFRMRAVLGRLMAIRKTPDRLVRPPAIERARGAMERARRISAFYSVTAQAPSIAETTAGTVELLWENPFRTVKITVAEEGPLQFTAYDGTYSLAGLVSDEAFEGCIMDWIQRY